MPGGKQRPGPKGVDPEVAQEMMEEIMALDHVKRRTWGTETIYEKYHGVIPKNKISQAIEEGRRRTNKQRRESAQRYEFVAPDLVWSDDFIKIKDGGRVLRVQDECSRVIFGYEQRQEWTDGLVARFVAATFERYGRPLFFKHDLGSEFRSGIFQSLLRGWEVMALPNPPYYAQYNGKHERTNKSVRFWLASHAADWPSLDEVLEEMAGALMDHNEDRPKEVLGKRTPQEVYENEPRVQLDRLVLYREWERLKEKLIKEHVTYSGKMERVGEMEAMRIAALVLLKRHKLIRYQTGPEAPEV
jgi:transposase InsO family protein